MMKKSGVKKMQVGGMAARRAANRAANAAKRQAGFESRMAAAGKRRGVSDEQRAANRASNAAKRKAGFDTRMAAEKARRQPGRAAFKERIAAARAKRAARGMNKGGSVDGCAMKGKTRGTMI